ncbi:TonB-dependent siderophore receptor [Acinetobacter ursingii]|uniref:TonB-dependent siderophore receptor n=1 Tax=Acinetobacter ursingii TaxID=108980 RepID=UPI003AF6F52F
MPAASTTLFRFKSPLTIAIHSIMLGTLFSSFSTISLAAETTPVLSKTQSVQIRAGNLDQALALFAGQTNSELSYDPILVAGKETQGLNGQYTFEQGITQLLKETGLTLVKRQDGTWGIINSKTQPREVGQLQSIHSKANNQSQTSNSSQLPLIVTSANSTNLIRQNYAGALGSKSVLDTPFSVTVVESDDIKQRGAKTLGQIFINDPAVYSQSAAMATDWWGTAVRGLGVSNYYIDGFPMSLNWGGDFPVEAAESVAVLKGLTGFMYGFGSPGGAISYQLKRPQMIPKTTLELGYRNPSMFSALVDTSHYINEVDLGYRFVLGGDKGETYNTAKQNRLITSLALDKKITNDLKWTANVIYENNKTEHEPPIFSFGSLTDGFPKATYDYDHLTIDNSFYKTNTFNAFTGFDWKINDDWALKYQLGYTRKEHHSNLVFDYLTNTAGDYKGNLYQFAGLQRSNLNQLMLNGKLNTGFIEHDLVTGIGYTTSTYQSGVDGYWGNDFNGNIYQDQSYIITRKPNYSFKPKNSETTQTYGYLSDTIKFNEKLQTILGLRYTYYDQEDLDYNPAKDSGYSTKATTPTIAFLYKPVPNATIYTSYVESLEAGSVVAATYANAGDVLDATVSKQYEIGAKFDAQPVGITAAIFKMERAATMESIRNDLKYLTQDGLTNYQGAEFNLTYKPIDRLKVGLGGMYLDAEIKNVALANQSVEGNSPAGVAKWSGVANAEYMLTNIEGLSLHGNIRYNGSAYTNQNNTVKIPAYTLVGAGFSYKFKLNGYDTTINGNINNLFNKKYWASSGTWASIGEAINGVLTMQVTW